MNRLEPSLTRCHWAAAGPLEQAYHDSEWGVPQRDDRKLFELLLLEGAQAGLSWSTTLRKRAGYARAFAGFDPVAVAAYGEREIAELLADPAIVRNRLKIRSAVENAGAFLAVQAQYGTFAAYLWQFVGNAPVQNQWSTSAEVPARTALSDEVSRSLRAQGFRFVGSTICYAFLQAAGLVNDHTTDCFRWSQVRE